MRLPPVRDVDVHRWRVPGTLTLVYPRPAIEEAVHAHRSLEVNLTSRWPVEAVHTTVEHVVTFAVEVDEHIIGKGTLERLDAHQLI